MACVFSFLSPADKLLSLAPLSSNWHSLVHNPYFWKNLPSSLVNASFITIRSFLSHFPDLTGVSVPSLSVRVRQTPPFLPCFSFRDCRLSWVPYPQWIQSHSSSRAEHSSPLQSHSTRYLRSNCWAQVHQATSQLEDSSGTPALFLPSWLWSPSPAWVTSTWYTDSWFLGRVTLQTGLFWFQITEEPQSGESKESKQRNESRSGWSFSWPGSPQSDRNQGDWSERDSQKFKATQGDQSRTPALFSLSIWLTSLIHQYSCQRENGRTFGICISKPQEPWALFKWGIRSTWRT